MNLSFSSRYGLNKLAALSNASLIRGTFLLCVASFLLCISLSKPLLGELKQAHALEGQLKSSYIKDKAIAAKLSTLKKQLHTAQLSLNTLLKQLPNNSEIPELLSTVSKIGLSQGLTVEQIKATAVVKKSFYAEQHLALTAKGNYLQILAFINKLTTLDRIIDIGDFTLTRLDSGLIQMSALTKTYHYIEQDAAAQNNK